MSDKIAAGHIWKENLCCMFQYAVILSQIRKLIGIWSKWPLFWPTTAKPEHFACDFFHFPTIRRSHTHRLKVTSWTPFPSDIRFLCTFGICIIPVKSESNWNKIHTRRSLKCSSIIDSCFLCGPKRKSSRFCPFIHIRWFCLCIVLFMTVIWCDWW